MKKKKLSGQEIQEKPLTSIDDDFSSSASNTVEDIHEFEHKIALSFPQELSREQFQLQFVFDHFSELGILKGGSRTKNLVSHYFDTPDGNLYNKGLALRVRYEEDPKTGTTLTDPDMSIKNRGVDLNGTTMREEYEAHMDVVKNGTRKPILNLLPMVKKYGKKWAKKLGKEMSLDFRDYREVFSINCRRTTFKVMLFALPQADGSTIIKPEFELSKKEKEEAKKLIYEFALDSNRFFVPGSKMKVKKDYEIEFELKTHDCEYDPDPDSSDNGVTLHEAMAGRDWIRKHVEGLLLERGLEPISHTGLAKSERGELYRQAAGFDECPYDELTLRGRTDTFYTDYKSIAHGPKAANQNHQSGNAQKGGKKLHFNRHI